MKLRKLINIIIESEIDDILNIYELQRCSFVFSKSTFREVKKKRNPLKERVFDRLAEFILQVKAEPIGGARIVGFVNYRFKWILIDDSLSSANLQITFTHEIFHIILKERKNIFLKKLFCLLLKI